MAVEIEALREHHLEDVTREDVHARDVDRGVVRTVRHCRRERRKLDELTSRRRRRDVRQRTRQLGDTCLEAVGSAVVRVGRARVAAVGIEEDVLDEVEPLAEMIEGSYVTG